MDTGSDDLKDSIGELEKLRQELVRVWKRLQGGVIWLCCPWARYNVPFVDVLVLIEPGLFDQPVPLAEDAMQGLELLQRRFALVCRSGQSP
jgi:hypothetical protein